MNTTSFPVWPASPEALKRMPPGYDPAKADLSLIPFDITDKLKYPFKRMRVGHSFVIWFDKPDDPIEIRAQFDRLRVKVSQASKRLECKFTVIKHNLFFEVARIA